MILMNHNDRQKKGMRLAALYQVYDKVLSMDAARFYLDAVSELTYEEFDHAIIKFSRFSTRSTPPTPGELMAHARPTMNVQDQGVAIAGRVYKAVCDFGWTSPQGARQYIGETGWQVVEQFGGWQYICENLGLKISVDTFRAQIRDSARAQIQYDHAKQMNALPDSLRPQLTNNVVQLDHTRHETNKETHKADQKDINQLIYETANKSTLS